MFVFVNNKPVLGRGRAKRTVVYKIKVILQSKRFVYAGLGSSCSAISSLGEGRLDAR